MALILKQSQKTRFCQRLLSIASFPEKALLGVSKANLFSLLCKFKCRLKIEGWTNPKNNCLLYDTSILWWWPEMALGKGWQKTYSALWWRFQSPLWLWYGSKTNGYALKKSLKCVMININRLFWHEGIKRLWRRMFLNCLIGKNNSHCFYIWTIHLMFI